MPSTPAPSNSTENPYTALITSCSNNPDHLRAIYAHHRNTRHASQLAALLPSPPHPSPGITPDTLLARLLSDPSFRDPRHQLTIWARPPERIKELVAWVQRRLGEGVASSVDPVDEGDKKGEALFLPAPSALHMTVLEIASGRPEAEIPPLLERIQGVLSQVTELLRARARERKTATLNTPMVAFDASGVALSFLPKREGEWTYHHLRGEIYDIVQGWVEVKGRYVVPSAHLTIGRYLRELSEQEMRGLGEAIEWVNRELGEMGGKWTVGEEVGLEVREGACWYGDGGRRVASGRGIWE